MPAVVHLVFVFTNICFKNKDNSCYFPSEDTDVKNKDTTFHNFTTWRQIVPGFNYFKMFMDILTIFQRWETVPLHLVSEFITKL